MYGTMARLRPKDGQREELRRLIGEWNRERRPTVRGARESYFLLPDTPSDEVVLFAVFDDQESYRANASDPAQDGWYRRLRECLADDPTWDDGEVVR
jgi:quinol monooxygenase YgiN